MSPKERLAQALKEHGHSVTAQRLVVFETLQHQEPLTMHDIVARSGDIDRASVYRSITLFEELGIVQRLQTGWKYKLELSDAFHMHHHHATCLRCGRTYVLPEDESLETQLGQLAEQIGFRMERHQLELSGVCANCQLLEQAELPGADTVANSTA